MNDKTIEWIAQIKETKVHFIERILLVVFMIASFAAWILFTTWIPLILAAVFIFVLVMFSIRARVEYEFIFVSDELRITAIYNQRRRKKYMSFNITEIDHMSKGVEARGLDKPEYLCEANQGDEVYTLVVNHESERHVLVIEADPEFIKMMTMRRKYSPYR